MAPKHPLLLSSMGFRKAVVRHCMEQLREIEGRLPQASGPRWEQQLQTCEDLSGVAKMVLALQRRSESTTGKTGAVAGGGGSAAALDNVWVEELSQLKTEEVEDRAVEFTRRIKHRLEELRVAIPYPVAPEQLVGATVVRSGDGASSACRGSVIEHDEATGFRVLYVDGDVEDLTLRELQSLLARNGQHSAKRGSGALAAAESDTQPVENPLLSPEDVSLQAIFERVTQRHQPATSGGTDSAQGGKAASKKASSGAAGAGSAAAGRAAGAAAMAAPEGLPEGWTFEMVGAKPRFTSPDGLTQVTSVSKAIAWHKQQLALAARFAGSEMRPEARPPPEAAPAVPPSQGSQKPQLAPVPEVPPHPEAACTTAKGSEASSTGEDSKGAQASAGSEAAQAHDTSSMLPPPPPAAPGAPVTMPEYGLSMVEVEAAVHSPSKAGSQASGRKRQLPRELRNLAMPDRDWNVSMPFFSTAAKTREQFSASADQQAAAAAARERHQWRVVEAQRAAEAEEQAE